MDKALDGALDWAANRRVPPQDVLLLIWKPPGTMPEPGLRNLRDHDMPEMDHSASQGSPRTRTAPVRTDMAGAGSRAVRALVPMAADGVGPSQTCIMLAGGMDEAGGDVEIMVNRRRGKPGRPRILTAAPGPLKHLPHGWIAGPATRAIEAWYLRRLKDGDIAWLWPAASLRTHEIVAKRGNPIVLEGINSRMGLAKEILDAANDAFGAAPTHGITEARIAEEHDKIALASTMFAPSAGVEEGLVGTKLEDVFLKSSYGVDTSQSQRARSRRRIRAKVSGTASRPRMLVFSCQGSNSAPGLVHRRPLSSAQAARCHCASV